MQNATSSTVRRLRIYLGEDKVDVDQPLYESIVREARQLAIAGATVLRGSVGYGRSTRLHTAGVLFSRDLPVIVEIVDLAEKIEPLIRRLAERQEIGLMTCETVEICGPSRLVD